MDIHLHFEKTGSGSPLLLLHGNGEDCTYFVHQIEAFSKDFTLYAIDTRGHGKSPRGTAPFTISQFADDLLDFMNEHDLQQPDILGFSDGGNISLTFALRHPERVGRLILNGANLFPEGMHERLLAAMHRKYQSFLQQDTPEAEFNQMLFRLMLDEPQIDPAELHALTMPTLVIAGEKDMIQESHTRLIAENIPGSRLVILPGDHFIANKEPAAFNAAVRAFLEETL